MTADHHPATPLPPCGLTARQLSAWEQLTRRANQAFLDGRHGDALAGHRCALSLAETLLEDGSVLRQPGHCLAALVVSHHNLADVYEAACNASAAEQHLCRPHAALLRLLQLTTDPWVQEAVWCNLRETRTALLAHVQQHGGGGAAAQVLCCVLPGTCAATRIPAPEAVLH